MGKKKDKSNFGKSVDSVNKDGLASTESLAAPQPRVTEDQVPTRVAGVSASEGSVDTIRLGGYTAIGADYLSTVTNTNPLGVEGVAATIHGEGANGGSPSININNPRDSLTLYIVDNGAGSTVIGGISTYDLVTAKYAVINYNPDTSVADFEVSVDDFDATAGGRIRFTATGNLEANKAWTVYSSHKLKKDITDVESALERVLRMRPVWFRYKDTDQPAHGFIAEEMQEIEPDISNGEGIKYTEVIPLLVGAIQELTQRVEKLEGK